MSLLDPRSHPADGAVLASDDTPDWERYLDHASTSSPKAPGVIERFVGVIERVGASPGRSVHRLGRAAAELVERSRVRVARFFGCPSPAGVIFTAGATSALNLATKGLLRAGDHVVVTSYDHNSALRPLMRLRGNGVRVTIVRRADAGADFVDAVIGEVRPATRLVVINHASNVLGCVLPYEPIVKAVHARGALVLLDTAQTAGLISIDLLRSPVDLLVFSGHKALLGPPGVGGLIVRDLRLPLEPLIDGGTGHVSEDLEPVPTLPNSFEAGTGNAPAISALEPALDFVEQAGVQLAEHAAALRRRCVARLAALPGVQVLDLPDRPSVPVVSFRVAGMSPQRVAATLDERFGIQVRAGLHCAPLVHEAFGTATAGGTVRASFGYGNTDRSGELLCDAMETICGSK
jgi:selenocysteine lyase/cysteine desulfurase